MKNKQIRKQISYILQTVELSLTITPYFHLFTVIAILQVKLL